jgi:hypothetical protein
MKKKLTPRKKCYSTQKLLPVNLDIRWAVAKLKLFNSSQNYVFIMKSKLNFYFFVFSFLILGNTTSLVA